MRELRAALALAAALLIGLPGAASAHSGDATSVWPQLEPAFSAVEGGQALVAADDVSNGSFERPVIPDGAGYQSHEGTGIEDWHVDGRVDLASSELWAAAEGRQSVDLNELAPGGVWQDVATQVDADYDLTSAPSFAR